MKTNDHDMMKRLTQWVKILDNYELDITVFKEIDSFWYKQKLVELKLLLEMDDPENLDYLQQAYIIINDRLIHDQNKLKMLKPID